MHDLHDRRSVDRYLNYFAAWGPHFRRKASTNVQNMRENRMVRIVPQTPASFLAGLELYRSRLDKGYSMTDCVSGPCCENAEFSNLRTQPYHRTTVTFVNPSATSGATSFAAMRAMASSGTTRSRRTFRARQTSSGTSKYTASTSQPCHRPIWIYGRRSSGVRCVAST